MTRRMCNLLVTVLATVFFALLHPSQENSTAWSQTARQSPAVDTLRLSLQQAVQLALENNEDIGIARADLERAHGTKKEATAAALPHVGFRAGYTRNFLRPVIFFRDPSSDEVLQIEIGEENDYLINFSLDQVVFAFGRVGGAIKAADYYLKSNESNLEATRRNVKLETEIAYLNALLAVKVREIAIKSLDATQKHFEETKKKLRQNMASRFDSIRAEVEVKNREPAVLNAENAIRLARLNLKRVMSLDRNTPVILTDSLVFEPEDYSLEGAIEDAYKMRADIQALRLYVSMNEKIYQVTKRNNFPYLSLVGGYTVQGPASGQLFPDSDRFATSFGLGLSLSFPIFDGLKNRGKIAQARADVSAAQYSLQKLERVVALALNELFDQLGAERENLESQTATVNMAEEAYRLALVRFSNGLSTSLELEDSELALTVARLNYTEAVYRYMAARKRFEYAMGH